MPCMSWLSGEKSAIWERALKSKHTDSFHVFTVKEIHQLVRFVVMNTFIKNGSKVRRQVRGIPMGTNCAPLLANLYLYSYEADWINNMSVTHIKQAREFHLSFRYIDDLMSLDNPHVDMFTKDGPYPADLILNDTTGNTDELHFLGMTISSMN